MFLTPIYANCSNIICKIHSWQKYPSTEGKSQLIFNKLSIFSRVDFTVYKWTEQLKSNDPQKSVTSLRSEAKLLKLQLYPKKQYFTFKQSQATLIFNFIFEMGYYGYQIQGVFPSCGSLVFCHYFLNLGKKCL